MYISHECVMTKFSNCPQIPFLTKENGKVSTLE